MEDIYDKVPKFAFPPNRAGDNYAITLRGELPNKFVITASLPEQFGFGVQANYEPRLPNSILDASGGFSGRFLGQLGRAVNLSQQFVKINRVLQEFSHQTWQSTSPMQFSFPLLFDARTNARADVLNKIRTLMKVLMPYKKGSDVLLTPPGPTLGSPNDGRISIRIGNVLYIHSVLLTDVQANIESRFTEDGVPIAASCDVSVTTINTPHQGDIDSFFLFGKDDLGNEKYGIPDKLEDSLNDFYQESKDALTGEETDLDDGFPDTSEGDEPRISE